MTCQLVPVSAVIFTYNEEVNIEACLQSIAGWCREIFVVDSGSTDGTLEICRRYTDNIYTHPYVDHGSHWDWVLKNVLFGCEWVMRLDADNVVSEQLKRSIAQAVAQDEPGVDGYYAFHRILFRYQPIHGPKDNWLTLIRHKNTTIDHSELVDFRFVLKGQTRVLEGELTEHNLKEMSIDFWIDKHQRFSDRMAVEEVLRVSGGLDWALKPKLLGNPDERMIWLKNRWYRMPLFIRPFIYFLYRIVIRRGFLDGVTGLIFHFLQAFWFRLIVDIKISELRKKLRLGELSIEQLKSSFEHNF